MYADIIYDVRKSSHPLATLYIRMAADLKVIFQSPCEHATGAQSWTRLLRIPVIDYSKFVDPWIPARLGAVRGLILP